MGRVQTVLANVERDCCPRIKDSLRRTWYAKLFKFFNERFWVLGGVVSEKKNFLSAKTEELQCFSRTCDKAGPFVNNPVQVD